MILECVFCHTDESSALSYPNSKEANITKVSIRRERLSYSKILRILLAAVFLAISCGHTTDFYLGKTDLPRANSSKSPEVNSSRVLFYPGVEGRGDLGIFWVGMCTPF